MKKYIFSLMSMTFIILGVQAQTISVDDVTLKAGETKVVSINLTNTQTNIVSFQMDLMLPEGITINKAGCTLGSRIIDADQELVIGKQPDGSIRLTSTSLTLNPITGTNGEIIKLSLTAAKDSKGGTATLKGIILATSNSRELSPVDATFNISLTYTLTYMVEGNVYKSSSVVYGTAISPEAEPSKEGYTFSGWSEIPKIMPASDVVVTGSFTINQYKLTYIIDGKEYKSFLFDYNSVLVPESAPVKKGMTFLGWGDIPDNMPAHDVTLRGTYSWSRETLYSTTYIVTDTVNNYVSVIGNEKVNGEVNILPIVEIGGYEFSVNKIGSNAFYNCGELTAVTIPETVTSIDNNAFYGCSNLSTVFLEGNSIVSKSYSSSNSIKNIFGTQVQKYIFGDKVTSIGRNAFYGCTGLTSITIPEGVTNIGESAFFGCDNLITVILESNSVVSNTSSYYTFRTFFGNQVKEYILGDKITGIGNYAFYGCSALTNIIIPESVTIIGDYTFNYCTGLTSITMPNSVTSIGDGAFSGCNGLTSLTIPDGLIGIGSNAFQGCDNLKIYAKRGTDGLLSVWKYGLDPYETGTTQTLLRPSISEVSKTQTTIRYRVNNVYSGLKYELDNDDKPLGNNEYLITGVRPDYWHTVKLTVSSANNSYSTSSDIRTLPINPTITCENQTASSLAVSGSYTKGDAKVVSRSIIINGVEMDGEKGAIHGLDPNKSYTCKYRVVVEDDNGEDYTYYGSQSIRTASLTLSTQQPKVISSGNVIVAAMSNLDDEETKVGFEWRRTDWTDDFTSNTGGAYLFGGKMEGYIRNLNTDKLWKYRPYYESDMGKRYYGDWLGIDPTNTSYFEPTVYTYSSYSVTDNTAEVKGYAMRGSDNVTNQGFMYWKKDSSTRNNAKSIPANAKMVEAKGNVMVAKLENLDFDTEYCFVAFITTSENETFYGEEQTFKTGVGNQDMIDEVKSLTPSLSKGEGDIYDLNGRKLPALQKGINIIRMSDGTTKKVMVK